MDKKQIAVTTKKLILDVADRFKEVSKKVTRDVILNFLDQIEDYVATGKKVRLDKLGILSVKDRKARMGRNPQTGEAIKIPPSKKVSFRVSGSLKERVGAKKKKAATTKKATVAKKTTATKKAAAKPTKKAAPKAAAKKVTKTTAKAKSTKKTTTKRKK